MSNRLYPSLGAGIVSEKLVQMQRELGSQYGEVKMAHFQKYDLVLIFSPIESRSSCP
eukprot:COSAG02_NODE_5394_length_4367_cov_2.073805_2_plen_57_part_00